MQSKQLPYMAALLVLREGSAMKFAIVIEGETLTVVGPYVSFAGAQMRADSIADDQVTTTVVSMIPDREYFGKPVGNRTNH